MAAAVAVALLLVAGPAYANLNERDLQTYRQAYQLLEGGKLEQARRVAQQASERLPAKVLEWIHLTRPDTTAPYHEIVGFLRANPQWPTPYALRRRAEVAMPPTLPAEEVRAFFEAFPPLTNQGLIRYVDTLIATEDKVAATQLVRRRWIEGSFSASEEAEFRTRFGAMLRPDDHWARLDRLLWDNDDAAARRVVPFVPPGHAALADARLRLAQGAADADALVARVPEELRNDPGLHYERLRWARKRDRDDLALQLLLDAPPQLGRQAPWWAERHVLVRRAFERGDHALAYRLAKGHGQHDGVPFAEGEWLAGWLALQFLRQPADAFAHFERMYRNVTAPISIARAAYWAGRAQAALGSDGEARKWYELSAAYPTTFYGQLAGTTLGRDRLPLPVDMQVPAQAAASFERRELVRAVRMLLEIQRADRKAPRAANERTAIFIRRLLETAETPVEFGLIGRLSLDAGRQDIAIMTAKAAIQHEVTMVQAGYPILEAGRNLSKPEGALVHALIRQESLFNPQAVSPVGARGLMQLMPATANEVAKKLGLKSATPAKLTGDPDFNIRLGSTYLGDLLDRFNGSYILAIASYNAGAGRTRQWIEKFGDPRTEGIDPIDWIESIPFNETRNYVQRVMEGLQVYRQRLGGTQAQLRIDKDLRR
ncbi:MAG TPA: lytic transglycosylase domain-containing protein [Azospirillaceae bacterium]|nr:lytic transglycosylase domain-containing protein [Azospirillaceae bacterium]